MHDSRPTHLCMTPIINLIYKWLLPDSPPMHDCLTHLCMAPARLLPDSPMPTPTWLTYADSYLTRNLWPLSEPPIHDSYLPYMCMTHIWPGCAMCMAHVLQYRYSSVHDSCLTYLHDSCLLCFLTNLYCTVHYSCLTLLCMTPTWLSCRWFMSYSRVHDFCLIYLYIIPV